MKSAANEPIAPEDEKRQRILDSATRVALSYGFQRSTMDDIARAAEMSRPALYLLFKNKTEIYRAVTERHLRACAQEARSALSSSAPLDARLVAAVEPLIAMMTDLAASPHGEEMMDMKGSLAGDIVESWREEMLRLTAETIREAGGGGLDAGGLSAAGLAGLFWDGIEGMKNRIRAPGEQRAAVRLLARVVAGAVERP